MKKFFYSILFYIFTFFISAFAFFITRQYILCVCFFIFALLVLKDPYLIVDIDYFYIKKKFYKIGEKNKYNKYLLSDIKSYSKNSKQIIISFSNELITIENYMLSKKSKNKLIEILDNKLC